MVVEVIDHTQLATIQIYGTAMATNLFYFSVIGIFLCVVISSYLYYDAVNHYHVRQILSKDHNSRIKTAAQRARKESVKVFKSVRMTLLLAYARTGSTLTGEILHSQPRDFYLFEPLHRLMKSLQNHTKLVFLNGSSREISSMEELDDLVSKTLYNWFTCSFEALDIASLTDFFLEIFTPEFDKYVTCLGPKNQTNGIRRETIQKCVGILQSRCKSMNSVTIKTIRTPMRSVEYLLKTLPHLKVVYLFRDPRGMFSSQSRVGMLKWKELEQRARITCNRIDRDIEEFGKLYTKYPSRLKRLAYENLCRDPVFVASKLFMFLHRPFLEVVKYHIRELTSGPILKCSYCTKLGDALGNAYKWRLDMTEHKLNVINKYCSVVYQKLAYKNISIQQLKYVKETWQANIDFMQI